MDSQRILGRLRFHKLILLLRLVPLGTRIDEEDENRPPSVKRCVYLEPSDRLFAIATLVLGWHPAISVSHDHNQGVCLDRQPSACLNGVIGLRAKRLHLDWQLLQS